MSIEEIPEKRCFLALPYSQEHDVLRDRVDEGARRAGYEPVSLAQRPVFPGGTILEALVGELARADCIVADVSERNPNVFYELGLAQAMGKGVLLIAKEKSLEEIPFDLREFRVITYSPRPAALRSLSENIYRSLREFERLPRRALMLPNLASSPPFFVDWDRLSRAESENLCHELLAQMGFRRVDWGKMSPEIDLVAEYPRKDPDGFEYRELWLVSMGLRAPLDDILEMAGMDPDYLVHRISRHFKRPEEHPIGGADASVTLLLIFLGKEMESERLRMLHKRMEIRRHKNSRSGSSMRLRTWDRHYLTSLVQRFPQIGYKYFSDEGRTRSKARKSYEDLYGENSDLLARLTRVNAELKEEQNKRIRAERDAVWKDISFSAAHKIGNPIFAIETDLDPLKKRVREQRTEEAEEVITNMRASVEKAKAFVEQFKSLAKAQEIRPAETLLAPILQEACRLIVNEEIVWDIDCPPDLAVRADPNRLAECIDELVVNATHWFDKLEKRIKISVTHPAPSPLPDFVDSSDEYVLIHVKDNGCGIPVADKNRIFDAFFTTHDQGTGLGLALVRRIIDGHGGGIIESGTPGKGADFEIYVPSAKKTESDKERAPNHRSRKKKKKKEEA